MGDELLIGQVLNSNAQWASQELAKIGITVVNHLTVSDDAQSISDGLDYLAARTDVVLIGGGLGPTHDDLTLEVLAKKMDMPLEFDADWMGKVEQFFAHRKRQMPANNRKQALLLKNAHRIDNDCGTAAGQDFTVGRVRYFVFPGVPSEMKSMMTRYILPKLREGSTQRIFQTTLITTGLGESALAQKIDGFVQKIKSIPQSKLAFLPAATQVRLRLQWTGTDQDSENFAQLVRELELACGVDLVCTEPETLESVLIQQLRSQGASVAVAESCTGGLIGHRLTQVSGSSDVFLGGEIVYSTESKIRKLGLSRDFIAENDVVSEAVATRLADAVQARWGATYGIGITGALGPTAGDSSKEVGTVCFAVSSVDGVYAKTLHLGTDRALSKDRASTAALDLLRRCSILKP